MAQHVITEDQSVRVRQLRTGQTGLMRTYLRTQHRGDGVSQVYWANWEPDEEFLDIDPEDGEYMHYSEPASFPSAQERDQFVRENYIEA